MAFTLKQRILFYLQSNPASTTKAIFEALKEFTTNYDVISVYVLRMHKEGLLEKVEWGKYSLTDKGRTIATATDTLRQATLVPKSGTNQTINSSPLVDFDLEDINVIVKLKERYGKQRLIELLNKIRKIIE